MEALNLTKGNGLLNLSKAAPGFKTIKGVLNWDAHPVKGASLTEGFDLDICAFVLNNSGKLDSDAGVVYFGNKSYLNGVVTIPVDNRDGQGDDDEFVTARLNEVQGNSVQLFVVIYEGEKRGQNFGMVANSKFELFNLFDSGKQELIQSYNLTEYTNETAIHLGQFVKNGTDWNFESYGAGFVGDINTPYKTYS